MADDTNKPKRGRGRPRKDPNDTTTAPYVKHRYETAGKVGRPKNNPYEGSGWGGAREGAGIKPYLKPSEKRSESINFRVDPITKERYRRLQEVCNISDMLRQYISRLASVRLGANNVPDSWTPPKK